MRRALAVLLLALVASTSLSSPVQAGALDGPWKRALGRTAAALPGPLPAVLAPGTVRSIDDIRPSVPGLVVTGTPTRPTLRWTGTTCTRAGTERRGA